MTFCCLKLGLRSGMARRYRLTITGNHTTRTRTPAMHTVGSQMMSPQRMPPRGGEQTVGHRLRARRESLGIPIEAVVRKTRLPRRTLERLEADDFDAIGADFYVRGFLRIYTEHLGLPIAAMIEVYESQVALAAAVAEPATDIPAYFQTRSEPHRSLSPAQLFLLVVCAATLVVFMFSVQKKRGHRGVARRPAISAPGTPATASRPTTPRLGIGVAGKPDAH